MTAGEIVRMCRWGKGWSQRQLSEASGIARQTITDVERGVRGTSVTMRLNRCGEDKGWRADGKIQNCQSHY